ncbi:MAG: VCBS repeat-containing protein, partial [Bacteroidales bacterium]|nr:VCBS repeat-containing protein [Bacteroidales bacterium]
MKTYKIIFLTALMHAICCVQLIAQVNFPASLTLPPFTEQTGLIQDQLADGSVAWGDYDNDGDLDILIAGSNGLQDLTLIYRNSGNNTFTVQSGISLKGIESGSASWYDYDNDGFLDILVTGLATTSPVSKVYKNNGDNSFTEQTGINLPGVYSSSAAWGDIDNDGRPDLLIAGIGSGGIITKLFHNPGNNNFTELSQVDLSGVAHGTTRFVDYNSDGHVDIFISGLSANGPLTRLYQNNGLGEFTEQSGLSLQDAEFSAAAWGDYDDNGYPDLLLTGKQG